MCQVLRRRYIQKSSNGIVSFKEQSNIVILGVTRFTDYGEVDLSGNVQVLKNHNRAAKRDEVNLARFTSCIHRQGHDCVPDVGVYLSGTIELQCEVAPTRIQTKRHTDSVFYEDETPYAIIGVETIPVGWYVTLHTSDLQAKLYNQLDVQQGPTVPLVDFQIGRTFQIVVGATTYQFKIGETLFSGSLYTSVHSAGLLPANAEYQVYYCVVPKKDAQ